MKKKDLAKKMACGEHCNKDHTHTKGKVSQKGKGSLHSTMKHRIDVAGQDSYKEENS